MVTTCGVLVVGQKMWAMRRRNALDWRTNVSRGAIAEPVEVDAAMAEMARTAADAVGGLVAGVDLLPGLDGRCYAIEVNAVPGWQALSRAPRRRHRAARDRVCRVTDRNDEPSELIQFFVCHWLCQ